jgi:hypothetical protein
MKRVVNGLVYDIDKSVLVARKVLDANELEGGVAFASLYRTPGGAFFSQERISGKNRDDGESFKYERYIPLTASEAQEWVLKGDVELVDDSFIGPPEATAETTAEGFSPEVSATIYVRAPASLKRRVEKAAAEAHMSVNAYMCAAAEAYVISGKSIPPRPAYLGAYEPNTKAFPNHLPVAD